MPGFLALYALADFIPHFRALIGDSGVPRAEALIPLLLFGLAVGVAIDAISWALVRPAISLTGVKRPEELTYTALTKDNLEVHNTIIETNFRYHQFYANLLVALILYSHKLILIPIQEHLLQNGSFVFMIAVLFFAARDSLSRAYVRMLALLAKEKATMTNGAPVDPPPPKKEPLPKNSPSSKVQPTTPSQPEHPVQSGRQESAQEKKQ